MVGASGMTPFLRAFVDLAKEMGGKAKNIANLTSLDLIPIELKKEVKQI
jgi:N-acetylmuramic acid 6-phosphate (MurNAc-6-P) etherase